MKLNDAGHWRDKLDVIRAVWCMSNLLMGNI